MNVSHLEPRAGTERRANGQVYTNGGRVFSVNALGSTVQEAAKRCYDVLAQLSFAGMRYRKDIGRRS